MHPDYLLQPFFDLHSIVFTCGVQPAYCSTLPILSVLYLPLIFTQHISFKPNILTQTSYQSLFTQRNSCNITPYVYMSCYNSTIIIFLSPTYECQEDGLGLGLGLGLHYPLPKSSLNLHVHQHAYHYKHSCSSLINFILSSFFFSVTNLHWEY